MFRHVLFLYVSKNRKTVCAKSDRCDSLSHHTWDKLVKVENAIQLKNIQTRIRKQNTLYKTLLHTHNSGPYVSNPSLERSRHSSPLNASNQYEHMTSTAILTRNNLHIPDKDNKGYILSHSVSFYFPLPSTRTHARSTQFCSSPLLGPKCPEALTEDQKKKTGNRGGEQTLLICILNCSSSNFIFKLST